MDGNGVSQPGGLDPMHVREVLLNLAANTGLIEAAQANEEARAA